MFPEVTEPAREAARKILSDGKVTELPVGGHYGLWVARRSDAPGDKVFHEFEVGGQTFVAFEKEE